MIKANKFIIYIIGLILSTFAWHNTAHSKVVRLNQNAAEVLHLGPNISEVFVANPEIADVQMNSPTVAYIFGKKPGRTNLFATDDKGQTTLNIEVIVQHPIDQIKNLTEKVAPGENIDMVSTPNGLMLQGTVETPQSAKNVESAASAYLGPTEKITNNITVATPNQVYLKVKIAEVKRNVINSFGINWGAAINSPNHFLFGLLTGSRAPNDSTGAFVRSSSTTNSIGAGFSDGKTNLSALIDALNSENLASLLAEPNLVALSGQSASFLVGGEIPYPVPQDQNSVAIQFKKIGISLSFTPTVIAPNRIILRVKPEVSEIDTSNQLTFLVAGAPITVPAIRTRSAETSIELGSGQSLAIAGLFSKQTSNGLNTLPGLGDLPIIGALFKSTQFSRDETELVIIVTPYTIDPTTEAALALPTDTLYHATNFEMLLHNIINRDDSARTEMHDPMRLIGAAGFYLD